MLKQDDDVCQTFSAADMQQSKVAHYGASFDGTRKVKLLKTRVLLAAIALFIAAVPAVDELRARKQKKKQKDVEDLVTLLGAVTPPTRYGGDHPIWDDKYYN